MYTHILNSPAIHTRFKYVDRIVQSNADLFTDSPHIGEIETDSRFPEIKYIYIYSAFTKFFRTEGTFKNQLRLIYIHLINSPFKNFCTKLPINKQFIRK